MDKLRSRRPAKDYLNLYVFARANPVGFVDTSGRNSETPEQIKAGLIDAKDQESKLQTSIGDLTARKEGLEREVKNLQDLIADAKLDRELEQGRLVAEGKVTEARSIAGGKSSESKAISKLETNLDKVKTKLETTKTSLKTAKSSLKDQQKIVKDLVKKAKKAGIDPSITKESEAAHAAHEAELDAGLSKDTQEYGVAGKEDLLDVEAILKGPKGTSGASTVVEDASTLASKGGRYLGGAGKVLKFGGEVTIGVSVFRRFFLAGYHIREWQGREVLNDMKDLLNDLNPVSIIFDLTPEGGPKANAYNKMNEYMRDQAEFLLQDCGHPDCSPPASYYYGGVY